MGILEKHTHIKDGHIFERRNLSDAFMGNTFLKGQDYQSIYHEIENHLIDVICVGHKDGNTLASIGMPQPKCTTRTYMAIEFYNNLFLFVIIVIDGVGRSQRL
jgi:hypothetical protein